MIKVKEAIQSTTQYFKELYGSDYSNLSLEEVELKEAQNLWLITLGFDVDTVMSFPFATEKQIRKYKMFEVDTETGEVKSMKIRQL